MPVLIAKIPRKLEEMLGPEGRDEFVDFMNQALQANKEDVVQVVADRFERRLVEETSRIDRNVSGLRSEMKSDMAVLHRDIAQVQRDMAVQTRWILAVLLAAGVLYPVLGQLVSRLFPG